MKFVIQRRGVDTVYKYNTEDVRLAKHFAKRAREEFTDFLKAVVIFGSSVKNSATEKSDIDILLIVDDLTFIMTDEITQSYKIIVENLINEISLKLHITSMTFTSFWEYVKAGDPVAINILRDGYSIYDEGFFEPLQQLLKRGRIRPTEESIWSYYGRAPRTIVNSKWHVLQGTLDLYWAVIDAAHAGLMKAGEIPPSPEHAAEWLEKVLVPKGLEKKYVKIMQKFYKLSKSIVHREVQTISGREYDVLLKEARDFVDRMKILIDKIK